MGGRGSSGGAGGERVGIKLPQILGSEKQINWAKDILTDPYTTFEMNEKLRRSQSVGRPKTDEIRMWADRYISKLQQYEAICAPDFSTYTDMPLAMQIYNHYRKHWLAAYWQLHGMTVYPTISWSDESSYDWCFDGEPVGGIVAVSSVGTQANKDSKRLFLRGYEEMMKRLSPEWVIFYGRVPEECDWNVIRVKPHYDDIVKRRKANEISVSSGSP